MTELGLLGANGNGKSTFAKLVGGRLSPMGGTRAGARRSSRSVSSPSTRSMISTRKRRPTNASPRSCATSPRRKIRGKCAQFGFPNVKADTKVAQLSGGEKARLLMGLASFNGPHLLILDEPTNHLDIDSRAALIEAINDYRGAIILVSHDRHLLEACADRLWVVDGGTVKCLRRRHGRLHEICPRPGRRQWQADPQGSLGSATGRERIGAAAAKIPRPKPAAPEKAHRGGRGKDAQVPGFDRANRQSARPIPTAFTRDPAKAAQLCLTTRRSRKGAHRGRGGVACADQRIRGGASRIELCFRKISANRTR